MDVPIDSARFTRPVLAKPTKNRRRAHVRIDKRFAIGRRYKELVLAFRARFGPEIEPDPLLLTAIGVGRVFSGKR